MRCRFGKPAVLGFGGVRITDASLRLLPWYYSLSRVRERVGVRVVVGILDV